MSWIVKLFTGLIAIVLAHRILSIILSIIFAFIVYKAITDPKFLNTIIDFIKGIFGGGVDKYGIESAGELGDFLKK